MKYFQAYPCSINDNEDELMHERIATDIESEIASSSSESVGNLKGNEVILRLSRSSGLNLKILSMIPILMINIQKVNQNLQLIQRILILARILVEIIHLENLVQRLVLTKVALAVNHLTRY